MRVLLATRKQQESKVSCKFGHTSYSLPGKPAPRLKSLTCDVLWSCMKRYMCPPDLRTFMLHDTILCKPPPSRMALHAVEGCMSHMLLIVDLHHAYQLGSLDRKKPLRTQQGLMISKAASNLK